MLKQARSNPGQENLSKNLAGHREQCHSSLSVAVLAISLALPKRDNNTPTVDVVHLYSVHVQYTVVAVSQHFYVELLLLGSGDHICPYIARIKPSRTTTPLAQASPFTNLLHSHTTHQNHSYPRISSLVCSTLTMEVHVALTISFQLLDFTKSTEQSPNKEAILTVSSTNTRWSS